MELIAFSQIIKFAAALTFVIALMVGLSFLLRRIGIKGHDMPSPGRKRRLRVIEITALDSRRRLALIQRDDRQHLIILGPNGETVIETGIEETETDSSQDNEIKKAA
jgi:flagellar protein FliO/FliZ